MIIDSQLKWKEHTQLITKKLGASCGIVNKIKKYLLLDILENVYYSITYPHLQYGITTWGYAAKKYLSKVQVMQNRLTKIMTKSNYRKTKLSPIYARLSVLQLDKIFQLEMIKLTYCLNALRIIIYEILASITIQLDLSKMIYITRFE